MCVTPLFSIVCPFVCNSVIFPSLNASNLKGEHGAAGGSPEGSYLLLNTGMFLGKYYSRQLMGDKHVEGQFLMKRPF